MVRGSPIRKSSDHSLVIDSPRLIADSYVLHRFLVPRHPPYALKNLHKKTSQSTTDASRPLCNSQTTHSTTTTHTNPDPQAQIIQCSQRTACQPRKNNPNHHHNPQRSCTSRRRSFLQDPTTCRHPTPSNHPNTFPQPQPSIRDHSHQPNHRFVLGRDSHPVTGTMIDVPPLSRTPPHTR